MLAAGRSTRMGARNKLLAEVDGAPMVARVVDSSLASRADPVLVVTGHDAEGVGAALAGRAVTRVHNPDFADGLSTSVRAGLEALGGGVDAALVCLADMPWVTPAHLDALIDAFASAPDRPICVPVHAARRGNPVLWPARHFSDLRALTGDVGGRALLRRFADAVRSVPVADAAVTRDVDEPIDLAP